MKSVSVLIAGLLIATVAHPAFATTASQREYSRGYKDCMAGRYDQNQHGVSYKKGCRAAEDKLKGKKPAQAGGSASAPSASTGGVPSADKQACLAAVQKQTQNSQQKILSTESSEANNMVLVGVGAQRAPWKCLVKDGVVDEVMSMTNEGAL
jgi:hypothetical protein